MATAPPDALWPAAAPSDPSRVWLPEILCRVARYLPPNDVATCLRLADRCAAAALRGSRHTTVRLSQPVHPAAFAQHWLHPGPGGATALRALTRDQRTLLLRMAVRSGVLENVQQLLVWPDRAVREGFAMERLDESDLVAAAAAGHVACVRWLLEVARVACGPAALEAACRRGRREVVVELLASGVKAAWSDAAAGCAAEGGHLDLTLWLLNARPTQVDVARLLEGAAAGLDAATLHRLHLAWAPPQSPPPPQPALPRGRPLPPDTLAEVMRVVEGVERMLQQVQPVRCGLTGPERARILAAAASSPTPDWVQKMALLKDMWGGDVPRDSSICTAAAGVRARALARALNGGDSGSRSGSCCPNNTAAAAVSAASGLARLCLEQEAPIAAITPPAPVTSEDLLLTPLPSAWPRLQWLMRKGFPLHAGQALDTAAAAGDTEAVRGLLTHPRVRQVLSTPGCTFARNVADRVLDRGVGHCLARPKTDSWNEHELPDWEEVSDRGVTGGLGLLAPLGLRDMLPVLGMLLDACGVVGAAVPKQQQQQQQQQSSAAPPAPSAAAGPAVGLPQVPPPAAVPRLVVEQGSSTYGAEYAAADPVDLLQGALDTGSLEVCDWMYARCFGGGGCSGAGGCSGSGGNDADNGTGGSCCSSGSSGTTRALQPGALPLAQLPRAMRLLVMITALRCTAWGQPSLPLILWLEARGGHAVTRATAAAPPNSDSPAAAAAVAVDPQQAAAALAAAVLDRAVEDMAAITRSVPSFELRTAIRLLRLGLHRGDVPAAGHLLQQLGPEVEAALGGRQVLGACMVWWAAEGGSPHTLDWVTRLHPPHEVWAHASARRTRVADGGFSGEVWRLDQLLLQAADESYVAAAREGDVATLRALRAVGCPWRPSQLLFRRIVAPGIEPLAVFAGGGGGDDGVLPAGCNPEALAAATGIPGQKGAGGRNNCTVAVLQWLLEAEQGPCPAEWEAACAGAWHWAGSNLQKALEWIVERRHGH